MCVPWNLIALSLSPNPVFLFLPRSLTAASLRFVVTNFVSLISVQCTKSSLTPLLLLSPTVVAKSYPIRIVIQFSRYNEKVSSLIPTGKRQVTTLNGKIFANLKIPLTYLHKGGRNAHPFWGFFRKNFLKNLSLHLFPLGELKFQP